MAIELTHDQCVAGRVAAVAILVCFACVLVGFYGLYVPLLVHGNAAATATNILAHEAQFRMSVTLDCVYAAGVIAVSAAIYRLLAPVNRGIALMAALLRLMYAVAWVQIASHLLKALRLLAEPFWTGEPSQFQGMARLELTSAFDQYYLGLPFYGAAVMLVAWLLFKSRYVPRPLALFGLIASGWATLSGVIFLAEPQFGALVNLYSLDTPLALFELVFAVSLLRKVELASHATDR